MCSSASPCPDLLALVYVSRHLVSFPNRTAVPCSLPGCSSCSDPPSRETDCDYKFRLRHPPEEEAAVPVVRKRCPSKRTYPSPQPLPPLPSRFPPVPCLKHPPDICSTPLSSRSREIRRRSEEERRQSLRSRSRSLRTRTRSCLCRGPYRGPYHDLDHNVDPYRAYRQHYPYPCPVPYLYPKSYLGRDRDRDHATHCRSNYRLLLLAFESSPPPNVSLPPLWTVPLAVLSAVPWRGTASGREVDPATCLSRDFLGEFIVDAGGCSPPPH